MKQFTSLLNEAVMPDVINDAINNRYRVIISYDDGENHVVGPRLIEPYVLFENEANHLALRSFQYEGATLRGIPKWKEFLLDKIVSWKPTKQHFFKPPNETGWTNIKYNNEGDGSAIRILNQVRFDNTSNNSFSPNNRLNDIRKNIDNIKKSTPIKIDDFNSTDTTVKTDDIKNIEKQNIDTTTDDFQAMLNRNLAITDKEKAKRGFSLSKNKQVNNPISNNNEIDDSETTNQGPVNNTETNNVVNNDNNEMSDFQAMLNRNLAITDKEKAKRGFSLKDKKFK